MASDFAPTLLSPVGYGIAELRRLLIDFQVRAFTTTDGEHADIAGANICHRVPPAITLGIWLLCRLLIWPWMAYMHKMQEQF